LAVRRRRTRREKKKTKVPRNTKEQFVRFINYYLRAGEERKEKEHEKERKEKQKVTNIVELDFPIMRSGAQSLSKSNPLYTC